MRTDVDRVQVGSPGPRRPPISVAIACHNDAPTLARAIDSVLTQDPPPYAVVVCDDGSTDDTAAVLAGYGSAVQVVRHGTNRGEAAAKNSAIRAATTPFVALLDADDESLPGRLAAVADLLTEQPGVDIVTTDAFLVHGGQTLGRWYGPGHPFPEGSQREAILDRNFVFGHVAVRREAFLAVGGFDERVRHATDWDCWIRMIYAGSEVGWVPRPLARYRLHESSLSSDRPAMTRSVIALLTAATADLDLTDGERAIACRSIREHARRARRDQLRGSVQTGPAALSRQHALAVARDATQPVRSRVLAVVAYLVPAAARVAENRRDRASWTGPGDVRLPRAPRGHQPGTPARDG